RADVVAGLRTGPPGGTAGLTDLPSCGRSPDRTPEQKVVVLDAELVLQGGDLAALGVFAGLAALAGVGEVSGTVLEGLLLPEVEAVHGEAVLLAEVGDGLLLQEVEAKQGDLLFRGKVPTFSTHGSSSARGLPPTPAKANSSSD